MARASTTYPSWQTTRACIIASIASLNLSSGSALAASRSSIMLRTCMSRAAHPRVKAPPLAAAAPATALRQSAASVHRANRCNRVLGMADLSTTRGVTGCVFVVWSGSGRREAPAAVVTISGSVAAGGVAREHGADRRIRIRADVLAVHEHVVGGVGAVVLGRRQHGRGGANDQSKGNRGLRKHDFSLLVGGGRAHRAGVCAYLGGRTAQGKSRRGTNTSVAATPARRRKAPPNGAFVPARRMQRTVLRSRDWSTGAGSRA